MAWLLSLLRLSEYADIVVTSKGFLPTDIGCTVEETKEGYRLLYDKGLIEKVKDIPHKDDAIAIRLVAEGLNDSKHPTPCEEEGFGLPGLRIDGKPTIANIFILHIDEKLNKALEWLAKSPEKLQELRDLIQETVGETAIYVEQATTQELAGEYRLAVRCRYPLDVDDEWLLAKMEQIAQRWVRQVLGIHR